MDEVSDRSFKIAYELERGDFVAMTIALVRANSWPWYLLAFIYIGCAIIGLVIADGLEALRELVRGELHWLSYSVLAAGLLITFGWPYICGALSAAAFRSRAVANKPVSYSFAKDGVQASAAGLTSSFAWSVVMKAIETPNHLFLAISKSEALIVPKRAFAAESEFHDLATFAKGRVAAG